MSFEAKLQNFNFKGGAKGKRDPATKWDSKRIVAGRYEYSKKHSLKYDGGESESGFKDDKVSIWLWNINGINAVLTKNSLQKFLDEEDPDVICFNETKIDEVKLNEVRIQDYIPLRYIQYWNCCTSKKGYSGTAVFTKV